MIVYDGSKEDFLKSVEQDSIATEIEENIYQKMHRSTARNEFRSWENSLLYMYKVLNDTEIPADALFFVLRFAQMNQIDLPEFFSGKLKKCFEISARIF